MCVRKEPFNADAQGKRAIVRFELTNVIHAKGLYLMLESQMSNGALHDSSIYTTSFYKNELVTLARI